MTEKDIENLIAKYPDEFFPNEGFELEGQQVRLGSCRADILFKDRHGRRIIVEVKKGTLHRDASGQIVEYYGRLRMENPGKIIELILCANNIPRERRMFLVEAGIDCHEITQAQIQSIAQKHGYLFIDEQPIGLTPPVEPPIISKPQKPQPPAKAILFSLNPKMMKDINVPIRHLSDHEELYWEVGFSINKKNFIFPILGFIHVRGRSVEYVVTIKDIVPFSREHYENPEITNRVKPVEWRQEWKENAGNIQNYHWKKELVLTKIESYTRDTRSFKKNNGNPVTWEPHNYTRVLIP